MSIRQKIIAGFLSVVVAFVLFGLYANRDRGAVDADIQEVGRAFALRVEPSANDLLLTANLVHTMELGGHALRDLVRGDPDAKADLETNLAVFRTNRDNLRQRLQERHDAVTRAAEADPEDAELQSLKLDTEARIPLFLSIVTEFDRFDQLAGTIQAQVAAGATGEADRLYNDEARPVIERIQTSLANFEQLGTEDFQKSRSTLDAVIKKTAEQSRALTRTAGLLLAVALALAAGIGYLTARAIADPIVKLRDAAVAIGAGDLGQRVEIDTRDEIGALAKTFNQMVEQLRELYGRLERQVVDLEESEAALKVARDEAEGATQAKSQFLANMSHELRTPLNAIIGYSEMLREDAEADGNDAAVEDLGKIQGAGRHLLALINDILDLSKVEAGRMDLYLETFDLAQMIKDVAATVQPLVEQKQNTLRVDCAADVGAMHADLTKVRQSLFNLLSNAAKFTQAGTISLEVRRHAGEGGASGDMLSFGVADTGVGMTAEQIEKVFEPFTQADASTTRVYGGTGLGLTITKQFCHLMGGDIEVESSPGHGTTFTMNLPAEVKPPSKAAPEDKPRASSAARRPAAAVPAAAARVLVIDDDGPTRELLARNLEKAGFAVTTAPDGAAGLALARSQRPDAITLDVLMPGMDGWKVLSELKADADLAHIPVIMITFVDEKPLAYAIGAADFMSKPVDRDRLASMLKSLITSPPS